MLEKRAHEKAVKVAKAQDFVDMKLSTYGVIEGYSGEVLLLAMMFGSRIVV